MSQECMNALQLLKTKRYIGAVSKVMSRSEKAPTNEPSALQEGARVSKVGRDVLH